MAPFMTAPRQTDRHASLGLSRALIVASVLLVLLVVWAAPAGAEDGAERPTLPQAAATPQVTVARKTASDELPRLPDPPSGLLEPQSGSDVPTSFLPPEHHPWARFAPGAWRTLRTITETFDPTGQFIGRSQTSQTETLVDVNEQGYTLETTAVVHVGGKELRGAAQRTTFSLLTDTPAERVKASPLPAANLSLEGRTIPCQRWRVVVGEDPRRRVETVYYNPDLSPYILHREVAQSAPATDDAATPDEANSASPLIPSTEPQSTTTVVRSDAPVTFEDGEGNEADDAIVPGAHVAVETRAGAHRIAQFEVHSDVIPGGLVSATSTERDATGRRVRWSTTELFDYGQAGDPPQRKRRWRLFRRGAP